MGGLKVTAARVSSRYPVSFSYQATAPAEVD